MSENIPVTDVVALLDAQWNSSNVTEPIFVEVNHVNTYVKHDLMNGGDLVTIRSGNPSLTETPIGNHSYGNREFNLIIDVFTALNRQRLWDLGGEIRRICHAKRHTMTNFQRILFLSLSETTQEENEQIWDGEIRIVLQNAGVILET